MTALTYFLLVILNIISSLFGIKSLSVFLTIKKSLWKKCLLLTGFWLLISMIIFVGDLINLPPTFVFFMVCLFISCEGSFMKKLTIGLIFSCTALSFSALIDNFILDFLPTSGILTRCCLLIVFWGLICYISRNNVPDKHYELPLPLWRLIFLLALIPFGILVSVILLSTDTIYSNSALVRTYSVLLLLPTLTFSGLLQTILVLARQQKLEQQNALLHANEKYYESIREQQFEVRRLKHDLANHLQAIYSLPTAEKNDYIEQLLQTPVCSNTLHYSEDDTVNAVLSAKKHKIDDTHITLHVKTDIPRELPFAKPDTCALFANALDNAIEACSELPLERRMIILEAGWRKSLFVLRISNSAKEKNIHGNTLPPSTKKDKASHGYGLRSIQEIVNRYGGSMEINTGDGVFCLLLYLPVPEH